MRFFAISGQNRRKNGHFSELRTLSAGTPTERRGSRTASRTSRQKAQSFQNSTAKNDRREVIRSSHICTRRRSDRRDRRRRRSFSLSERAEDLRSWHPPPGRARPLPDQGAGSGLSCRAGSRRTGPASPPWPELLTFPRCGQFLSRCARFILWAGSSMPPRLSRRCAQFWGNSRHVDGEGAAALCVRGQISTPERVL